MGHFVVNSLNFGFHKGELSSTQKEGVITCIPKGGKSKKYIKNWRPISLLNITYKIASGCIAQRLKTVLNSIIDLDQSGFMSGRFTGDNIRLIYDILYQGRLNNTKGILLLIDFEKAFDSVSWSFMEKCFVFFNFKKDIIAWIKTFYKNIKSTVIVNNKPTDWFFVERGCRQGDPISPYIFLICSEVLAHMIRQNEEIKGYTFFERETKISQYADDTSLILDGSQRGFEKCVETVLEYAKYSGLSMNFDKTKVVWFGCQAQPNETFMPHLNFEWNPKTFSILGVEFNKDLENLSDLNIEKKLVDMQREINAWSKRDITPFGKVTIIKSLIISKIVHILIALPSPSTVLIKKINKMLFEFLWDGKPDKIKRSTAKLKFEKGGLGMIDVELFDKSLKLTWLRKLIVGNSKWKALILTVYPELEKIPYYGDQLVDEMKTNIENPFWKDVITYFCQFHTKFLITTDQELKATCFQRNSRFKIDNLIINDNVLKRHNIFFIKQLMNNSEFLSYDEFIEKYNLRINFLSYMSLITCIKVSSQFEMLEESNASFKYQPPINTILRKKKGAADIYDIFLDSTLQSKGKDKWKGILEVTDEEWFSSFYALKFSTKDCKLRWLQFRILHSILTTNRSVAKYNENQSDLCSFCNKESETIYHLIWDCNIVKEFWHRLILLLRTRCKHMDTLTLDRQHIILGQSENIYSDPVFDLFVLLAKRYIYRSKVQGTHLEIKHFLRELFERYKAEKLISRSSIQFKDQWEPYSDLFKSIL